MAEGCYRPDEILNLDGNELHLSRCPTCRSLFDRGQAFLGEVRRTAEPASAAGAGWKAGEAARERVEQFCAQASEARGTFPQDTETPTPELVLACCEQSRNALLRSPNEAQRWLEAAERILGRIPPSENKWRERDRQWAEARVKASRGNLLAFCGHILVAQRYLSEAQADFIALGDEFQAALSSRSMAFTLAKSGRLMDAKSYCIRCSRIMSDYGVHKEGLRWLNNLALVWLALSEYKKAALVFNHLLERLEPADPYAPTVRRNAILPQMETKQWTLALHNAESLAEDLEAGDFSLEKARTIRLKGEILLLMGKPREAWAILQEADALLGALDAGYEIAQARALLGQAHLSLGHRKESEEAFFWALQYYGTEGFAVELVQLMEAWNHAARQGGTGDRQFAEYRRYWQFKPAISSNLEGPNVTF